MTRPTPTLRRIRPLLGLLAVLALLGAACGSGDDDNGSGSGGSSGGGGGEEVSLTLGTVESITNLPVVVGQAKGYFEDQGIDLEVEYMASGVNIVPALASGQIDIGEGSVTPGTFNSFGQEVNAPVVAYKGGCEAGFDFCPLMISNELAEDFEDWTSIRGKTVAISARWTASHQKLVLLDEEFGVSPDEYELIELPFSDIPQALTSGAIDAAVMIEPIATSLEVDGVGMRVLEPEMEPSVPVVFTSYAESLASDTSPDSAGVRYQMAFIQAVRDILAARDALAEGDSSLWDELVELPEVSEAYPALAAEETREMVSISLLREEPYVTEEDFTMVRDFYVDGDQLTDAGAEVAYEDLVVSDFVDQALEELG